MSDHTETANQEWPFGQVQTVALEQLAGRSTARLGTLWVYCKFFL